MVMQPDLTNGINPYPDLPEVSTITVSTAMWQEMSEKVDRAAAVVTRGELIANELENAANTLIGIANKLRHQANAIRSNRQQVNAALYPVSNQLRSHMPKPMSKDDDEVLH